MLEIFKVIFSRICVLYAFIGLGYWASKTEKVSQDFRKGISNLIVYIFLPCFVFGTFANNFKLDILTKQSIWVLIFMGILGLFIGIAFVFSKLLSSDANERDVYLYSFTIPNGGYFGYPLVAAIFGEQALLNFMIFNIPFSILTYTWGLYVLNPDKKVNLKKLLDPNLVSMVLGMVVGALSINVPSVIVNIIDTGASCMSASAMLLTGMVFASKDLKKLVSSPKIYVSCFLKLFVMPFIAVLIISTLNVPESISVLIVMMFVLPPGLNGIVVPEAYGGNSTTGAQLCFVSTTMCMVTIPLIFMLYNFFAVN